MRIIADDPELERHLARLHDLIVSNGGFVHEECVIVVQDGNLRIEAPRSVPEGIELIRVPEALLLSVDDFGLYQDGDDIRIGTPSDSVTPVQAELMDSMIAIYNISGKIKDHRVNSPSRLYLAEPDIYRRLVMATQFKPREALKKEDFLLQDFLHTRTFGLKSEDGQGDTSVLMPIIDFLNHHQGATGFQLGDKALSVVRRSPLAGSDECFVSYSRMDAQIAYFNYGFVDRSSTSLLSVPLTISLPGVVDLQVNRFPAAKRKQAPPAALKDIRRFVPRMSLDIDKKRGAVSSLPIPDAKSPRALRRILMAVLMNFMRDMSPDDVKAYLDEAEQQVIQANRSYYKGLIAYASGLSLDDNLQPVLDDTTVMAEHQLRILEAYELNLLQLGS